MKQTRRPKVVHITSSLAQGGAEQVLYTLVCGLRDRFDQTVIYFHDGPVRIALQELGIAVIPVQGRMFRYDPWFLWRLLVSVRSLNPDLMHTLLWAANVAGRIVGRLLCIPVISAYHNHVSQDGWFRSLVDVVTLRLAVCALTVSNQVANGLNGRFIKPRSIKVIFNGIAVSPLTATNLTRSDLGISDDALLMVGVGRFVPVKRFELLIQALALLIQQGNKHLRLVIVGYGPLDASYRQLIADLKLQKYVQLVIAQPATAYIALADLFVQPSDNEGVSLALLEAMAYGRCCIALHNAPEHQVLQSGVNGIYLPYGTVHDLVQAVQSVDHMMRVSLGKSAAEHVHAFFGQQQMISAYERLFSAVLKRI